MTTMLDQLYQLACRPGGVAQEEILQELGWTRQRAAQYLYMLEKHARYKVVVVRQRSREKRMFSNAADAQAWRNANPEHHVLARPKAVVKEKHPRPFQEPKERKVSRQVAPDAKGYPGFDARYQLPPDAKVFGAGFSEVGIGRDVTTGRPWGK
jgi:hypothetical protein